MSRQTDRRRFLSAATVAFATPYVVSSNASGSDDVVAPSDKITVGVIGIGPRCTYDLKSILKLPDVQCVATSDVQESRRQMGKKLVDEHCKNNDYKLYPDFLIRLTIPYPLSMFPTRGTSLACMPTE